MFTRFFGHSAAVDSGDARRSLRERYDSWRFRGDIAAIMASLDRLCDRQLDLIGMRREELFEAVSDLMMRAEEQRRIGRDVVELLETAPEDATTPKTVATARADAQAAA
ncbi:hypothetical protein ROJ8625_00185 [Roseivivax jejudonensis]|uniref:Uncharacterized protein n=1 Tax=Roseivivax jejudonensis TaxID=1529041 RepID=A0A1X6Y695_9RHOB|nr:hypothetical protein [Roseivivax jejudonensis]SLN10151.1 hypothetical protein ROJ8625_00185 [Roseivivax jejudonensis]